MRDRLGYEPRQPDASRSVNALGRVHVVYELHLTNMERGADDLVLTG